MTEDPTLQRLTALLTAHPLLGRLGPGACRAWAGRWQLQVLAEGDAWPAGQGLRERLYLVVEGQVRLQLQGADGQGVELPPGALFGAGAAPYGDASGWLARATAPGLLAWLSSADVAEMCHAEP
ncbi:MAG TPA: hypothetical protein PLF63_07760, partial [Rubrivivax sp.]|nr:hypothetical protein [Rubrivivax sp.]